MISTHLKVVTYWHWKHYRRQFGWNGRYNRNDREAWNVPGSFVCYLFAPWICCPSNYLCHRKKKKSLPTFSCYIPCITNGLRDGFKVSIDFLNERKMFGANSDFNFLDKCCQTVRRDHVISKQHRFLCLNDKCIPKQLTE